MTSTDEIISDLVSETEYSYEEKSNNKTKRRSRLSKTKNPRKKIKTEDDQEDQTEEDIIDNSLGELEPTESDEINRDSSALRKRRRRRKNRDDTVLGYVDMEASLDDDEGLNQEYSDEIEISKEEQEKYFSDIYGKETRKNDFFKRIQSEDPDSLARLYDDTEDYGDYEEMDNVKLSQLPSLKDAKLFSVRCKLGFEREAAVCLMNKFFAFRDSKEELNIFSASSLDKFPGHIFIEAHRDFHVKEAIKGIKTLNINTVKIVPVKEVTQIFSPDPSKLQKLEIGQFVRLKKGLYQGDLAVVEDFDEGFKRIKIKLLPRLGTITQKDGEVEYEDKENIFNKPVGDKKKQMRPPARFFNPEEFCDAKALDGKKRDVQVYAYKAQRFENGLLIKSVLQANLESQNVIPTLEEIQLFQKAEVSKTSKKELIDRAKKTIEENNRVMSSLQKGDKVKIISGDLKGLTGYITEVNDTHVKVQPNLEIVPEPISYFSNEVMKLFEVGDHVEILSGKFTGITGTIIKIDDSVAHIITEDNTEEMQVLQSNIKYCPNLISSKNTCIAKPSSTSMNKHDLIILNDNRTVGVIISAMKDSVVIIDSEGFTRNVSVLQILNKLNSRGHTKNGWGQDIYPRCIVRVNDGIHKGNYIFNKGKVSVVKHAYNNVLFLFDQNVKENSGIFVESVNNCHLLSSQVYDNTRMLARFNNTTLLKAQDDLLNSQGGPVDEKRILKAKQDPKTRRINLIGQNKTIIKGPYKGYTGLIQSLMEDKVRMELQAANRCVTVPLDYLNIDPIEREGYSS